MIVGCAEVRGLCRPRRCRRRFAATATCVSALCGGTPCVCRASVVVGVAVSQCDRYALTGGRCDLDKGHRGEHRKEYAVGFTIRWTDEAMARESGTYGSRFD